MLNYYKKLFLSYYPFLIPMLLFCMLGVLLFWNGIIQVSIANNAIRPTPMMLPQDSAYPVVEQTIPPVTAIAAAALDADSGIIFYKKNERLRLSPASTAKIMTALVALDYFKPENILTVHSVIDTQGSGLGLSRGQKLSFEQLLTGALVSSANDAAYTIAENYPGGVPAFVSKMNEKAKELNLYNTHFADPAGLDDDDSFTSAEDLVRLSAIAMRHPLFAQIVNTQQTTVSTIDHQLVAPIKNRNILLGTYGINGVKTGYTEGAGEVLSSSMDINGHRIYTVVMKSRDRFDDTLTLVQYLRENLKSKTDF